MINGNALRASMQHCAQRLSVTGLLLLAASVVGLAQQSWVGTRHGQAGKDLNAVYFADSKRGWIAGDGGFISATNDGGVTWVTQSVATDEAINDVYFRGKDDGYVLAGNRIFVTRDGGRVWRESRRFLAEDFGGALPELYSVRFTGKKKAWVVGSVSKRDNVVDSLLVYTDDGGVTWQRRTVPTREELIHIDFDNDERGWIVGARGTILHTTDGGETWTLQRSGTKNTLYHVDFRGNDRGWAVGAGGTILRTTTGGDSWSIVSASVRNRLLSVQFINDNEGWIVGREGVVLHSEDGGATWVQQETQTKQNLYALFVEKKNGWAVGGDGTVLQYER